MRGQAEDSWRIQQLFYRGSAGGGVDILGRGEPG